MDMNNKHTAVIAVGALLVIFVIIAIWYMATHQAPPVFVPQTATTTPSTTSLGPQHITENGRYYTIDTQYPGSTALKTTAGAQADAAAVATMKAFLEKEIARFKDNGNFANLTQKDIELQGLDQGRQYALQVEYKTYQSPHTVSYVYTLYEDTLGAHPNAYYRTFTFDTGTGAQIELDDLFTTSAYLQTLSVTARTDLTTIIRTLTKSDPDVEYISRGTTPDADNFQSWYVDGSNLVLVFPPYQVGPYAIGTILDPIPLSKLSSILKAIYN